MNHPVTSGRTKPAPKAPAKAAPKGRLYTQAEMDRATERARREDGTVAPLAFLAHLIDPDGKIPSAEPPPTAPSKRTKR